MKTEAEVPPPTPIRGRYILIGLLMAAVALAGSWGFVSRQPTYGGRTVNSWLRQGAECEGSKRNEAVGALRKMPPKAVPLEIKALTWTGSPWGKWYQGFYPKLPTWMQKHLSRPVSALAVRGLAYEALCGNEHTREYLPEILNLLNQKNSMVRGFASNILNINVREQDTVCIPALIQALTNENENVRDCAAEVLGRFRAAARAGISPLTQALKDTSPYVRVESARALSMIDATLAPLSARVLREAMSDVDCPARVNAAWRLKEVEPGSREAAMLVVIASLKSRDSDVRRFAASVLPGFGALATNATPQLTEMALDDSDWMVRTAARTALNEIAK